MHSVAMHFRSSASDQSSCTIWTHYCMHGGKFCMCLHWMGG